MIKNIAAAASLTLAVAVPAAEAQDWGGFYIGAEAGISQYASAIDFGVTVPYSDSQMLAGVLAGYNFQRGNLVFGAEADYNLGFGISRLEYEPDNFFEAGLSGVGSLRGRIGFATGNMLIYGTAGFAFAQAMTAQEGAILNFPRESASASVTGMVLGAGVEIDLGNGWSTRGEYRWYDFGDSAVMDMPAPYADRSLTGISYSSITVAIIRHF